MRPNFKKKQVLFLMFLSIGMLLVGCKIKRDSFASRQYHSMTTSYNVMYNGELAFQKGIQELDEKYEDNFWKILPIEPIDLRESRIVFSDNEILSKEGKRSFSLNDVIDDGQKNTALDKEAKENRGHFELAEEKAVKAIQKHSIKVGSKEKNTKMDDAYLLLGKSRYYTSRFVPALEAFNYIIRNYPQASMMDHAILWKAKTNIRMENEQIAVEYLEAFLKDKKLRDEILEELYSTMAFAYTRMDSVHEVIESLEKAVAYSSKPSKKSRNLFILGQLYRETGDVKTSQQKFDEVLGMHWIPYKYKVHAEMEKIKNYQLTGEIPEKAIARTQRLIKNRENRPYLDALYYHLGQLYLQGGEKELALESYTNSIHAKKAKDFQKSLSYEAVGTVYMKDADYLVASKYYDSVLQLSEGIDTKRIRMIRRKKTSLESVVLLEGTLKRNDSLTRLLDMDAPGREAYFNNYIADLKQRDLEAAKIAMSKAQSEADEEKALADVTAYSNKKGAWYFYNAKSMKSGRKDFEKKWGPRALADDWRWGSNFRTNNSDNSENSKEAAVVKIDMDQPQYKLTYYTAQFSEEVDRDSLHLLTEHTLYQLGLTYKEQFQNYPKAITSLERVIQDYTTENLRLGAYYHMYKIYEKLNDTNNKLKYGRLLVESYPNSVFSSMLSNKGATSVTIKRNTPEDQYKEIFNLYKRAKYHEALAELDKTIPLIEGTKLAPKYHLLRAYVIGKTAGKSAFMKSLEYIVLNFANTEEGVRAKKLMNDLK